MINNNFKVKKDKEEKNYGRFVIEPLDQGYGHTLGNSLRRVLLSGLEGAAITSVRIEGVKHQFSTLEGVKEDIAELILNLKKIRLKIFEGESHTLQLSAKGSKVVTAKDLEIPSGVEIVNPDLYLATLSDKAKLEIELTAEKGFGYMLSDEKKTNTIGVIPVDTAFSPITRVNYNVEATRVGRMTNLDRLVIEIWTDGTIDPEVALKEAAKNLVGYFLQIHEPKAIAEDTAVAVTPQISDEILKMTIEELDLPTRITNSLRNGGIETIGQLLGTDRKELLKIKNLGGKSLVAVEEKLREKGVALTV
ncbi:DNA-directed RNA polymerase subunit alpha [Candidatus Microgenomates bacterium]|nr:DNA-directed RNA polymerase subunit alpha [Candidatus Microgenomates bacterium]